MSGAVHKHPSDEPDQVASTRAGGRRRGAKRRSVLIFPPRSRPSSAPTGDLGAEPLALPEVEAVRAGVFRTALRLAELMAALSYFLAANLLDWLALDWLRLFRRRTVADRGLRLVGRRAVRLRQILQRLGGPFVKIGQQLSIREDVLPMAYCRELRRLQDDTNPIAEDYVREVLERQGRRPLEEVFAAPFDFTPCGKASIACVYRARLPGGELVAVKVRRPGIVRSFKADLAALDWVLRSAEYLTLVRPGTTATFRSELKLMLLEELDLRTEARYQELFRRYFRRRPRLRTTAPRLHFELCGQDVIVSEFVAGVWMKELMDAVASGDPAGLAALPFDIRPAVVAKRLIRGSHYGFFECPFFHGDPHPANILIQPGNRIVMVDFGACGVFAQRERDQLAQMHYYHSREDVGGMVQCVIGLMEPLPPIDLDGFRRALEHAWWTGFYGVKSRHAQWQERTSFRLWSALLRLVQHYRVPMPLNVLRMIRATLLYDTVAARIYPRIDVFREYRRYYVGYARRVQRGVQRAFVRQLFCGLDYGNYVRLARLWDVGNVLLDRVQIFLHQPLPRFAAMVNKGYELLTLGIKWFLASASATFAAFVALATVVLRERAELGGHGIWVSMREIFDRLVVDMGTAGLDPSEYVFLAWAVLLTALTLKYVRQAWFRLDDKDHG